MAHSESGTLPLFADDRPAPSRYAPLAEQVRPSDWNAFEGGESVDRHLMELLRAGSGVPPSLILWGPPGTGKTTLARLVGKTFNCDFVSFSAVLGGVKEVREIVARAKISMRPTILFVDEIHRFTRAQQDAFLPHVENGTIVLIGATTENPSFYLTSALLSRARVVVLASLNPESLKRICERGFLDLGIKAGSDVVTEFVNWSGGDARQLLGMIETCAKSSACIDGVVTKERAAKFLQDGEKLRYDRSGEEHYNTISAFIKSLRGSDPDAALFWCFRMVESGEDPRFIIRRMMIFASEDIGNADPRALQIAVATMQAFEALGLPEGRIPLAQCVTYLACAPKSNRSYMAMNKIIEIVKTHNRITVPIHLRNAPTKLMKDLGYGEEYQYPHDAEGGFVKEVRYLPDEVKDGPYYEPTDRGYEKIIGEMAKRRKGS